MMGRKLNPDVHLICGKCGCGTMFSFKFDKEGSDDGEVIFPSVFLSCGNCGTLTGLNETAEDKTDWKKLKMYNKY